MNKQELLNGFLALLLVLPLGLYLFWDDIHTNPSEIEEDNNCGEYRIEEWEHEDDVNQFLDEGFHLEEVKTRTIGTDTERPMWILKKECE